MKLEDLPSVTFHGIGVVIILGVAGTLLYLLHRMSSWGV